MTRAFRRGRLRMLPNPGALTAGAWCTGSCVSQRIAEYWADAGQRLLLRRVRGDVRPDGSGPQLLDPRLARRERRASPPKPSVGGDSDRGQLRAELRWVEVVPPGVDRAVGNFKDAHDPQWD